jgi:hypothetical protein
MVQLLRWMVTCASYVIWDAVCTCLHLTCYGRHAVRSCSANILCRRTAQNSRCVLHKCLSFSKKRQSFPKLIEQFSTSLHRRSIRDSVVGTATGYRLDDRGVWIRVPVGSTIFSSPSRPDQLWGPPYLLSNGYLGVKRSGCEADRSSQASVEVKRIWIYTSTPHALLA